MSVSYLISKDLQYLKGAGPYIATQLGKIGLKTCGDLLFHFPRAYDDRRALPRVASLQVGGVVGVIVQVKFILSETKKNRLSILKAVVGDETGEIQATWFNQNFLKAKFEFHPALFIRGKVEFDSYSGSIHLVVSETEFCARPFEKAQRSQTIMPIYSLPSSIQQSKFRGWIMSVLDTELSSIQDYLPNAVLKKEALIDLKLALRSVHFPTGEISIKEARKRLAFDEFFWFQFELAKKRLMHRNQHQQGVCLDASGKLVQIYLEALPYSLTSAQSRCIDDILSDMKSSVPMNRLIQGDVGSGKTELAIVSLLQTIDSGFKGALLAPTQVLAEQHFFKSKFLLEALNVSVVLLTGNTKAKIRKEVLALLAQEDPLIVIGTHALLEDAISFKGLGLVVIDEQHRFGVIQRNKLREQEYPPHALYLTATPIPRSFMLTCFGDLDKSILDEMPPGRKPQETHFVTPSRLEDVYKGCCQRLDAGEQVYIVYPLVEESEKIDLKSAEEGYEELKNTWFSAYKVGLLHGRMSASEKAKVMSEFKSGQLQVLVATTVIEVGVDVSNATVMVIQHAERFGLSQLHQLRGRVGRSEKSSYCFLISEAKSESSQKRIKAMVSTTDGFKIAEYDLKIRGPGDMLGTRQSGLPDFKIGDMIQDEHLLIRAQKSAYNCLKKDPDLTLPEHRGISALYRLMKEKSVLAGFN